MCMIIYRPKGAASRVSKKTLKHCALSNPDGFGLMWVYKGKLNTARYLWPDLDTFIKRIQILQDTDTPFCAHFRFTTHGKSNLDNAHPYWIHPKKAALMHNGILNIKCERDWSDTRTFVNLVLRPLPDNWDQIPYIRWLVDEAVLGSKLVIMRADGSVTIVHEDAGKWDDGIWYSNTSYVDDGYSEWADYVWKGNKYFKRQEQKQDNMGGFNFKGPHTPATTLPPSGVYNPNAINLPPATIEEDRRALEAAEGRALAARLAWAEQESARARQQEPTPEAVLLRGIKHGVTSTFPKLNPTSLSPTSQPQTSALYMFEGLTVCEDCKRMETSAKDVPALSGVEEGDSCDLCHMPGTPTGITVRDLPRQLVRIK